MTIGEFIGWLLASGGIGWLCSALISWLDERWLWFNTCAPISSACLLTVTALVAGLIGAGAILLSAWLGYEVAPVTAQAWVERLFAIISAAIIAGQVRHGETVLRRGGI
jgi:hypothetical protein